MPIILNEKDDVAILGARAKAGERPLGFGEPLASPIPSGHKIARRQIAPKEPIHKFGQVIGYASEPISPGSHVHSHNCMIGPYAQNYQVGSDYAKAIVKVPPQVDRGFMGYKRKDGSVGTRNMIALCSTVNCSATVIRHAADQINRSGLLNNYTGIDGVVALAHGTGCGMASRGPGWKNLQRVLWGYATHPNVCAAIFVGLGCEVMQIARMKAMFDADGSERFYGLTIQDSGGTKAAIEDIIAKVQELLPDLAMTRTRCPASDLVLALQCGGSDGYSGMTANPALGVAADMLVGLGGAVVLAETPEIYGAEELLLRRAASQEVGEKLIARIKWWEEYCAINHGTMDNNPSPGNKAGGLTTILEKSLGAVAKAGATPLNDVLDYGEKIVSKGLVFMDSPGYDPVSVTGQIAGGAQLVVFTTGRGSAFGSKPAPTIKLATNDDLFHKMKNDMDVNCGDVLSQGLSLEQKGREILDYALATASGRKSKSEALGLGDYEFVPWQIGAVM